MTTVFVYEHLSGGAADAGLAVGAPRAGLAADAVGAVDADARAAADAAELRDAGRAMRDAVVADLLDAGHFVVSVAVPTGGGHAATADSRTFAAAAAANAPPTVAGHAPRSARPLSPGDGEAAVDVVGREAARHDLTWVIAPETGGLLGRLCAVVPARRWLGCRAGAIALTSSKRATVRRLAEHGVCTPLAFAAVATGPGTHWVVKPDDGVGALATRRHGSRAAAAADAAARGAGGAAAHHVEPWVDGEPLSLSLLCGARGVELLSVNRQSIGVDAGGHVCFQGVDANVLGAADARLAPLRALARQVGDAIAGLRGFVGVDLVWHPHRGPVVIEVNPRVTSAYVGLPAALRRRLAAAVIAGHLQETALPAPSDG